MDTELLLLRTPAETVKAAGPVTDLPTSERREARNSIEQKLLAMQQRVNCEDDTPGGSDQMLEEACHLAAQPLGLKRRRHGTFWDVLGL